MVQALIDNVNVQTLNLGNPLVFQAIRPLLLLLECQAMALCGPRTRLRWEEWQEIDNKAVIRV